jgi:tetratricopeptide (TPR) repeat protein
MVTGMLPGVLTDRYELPLSTASSAARDAYVEGCEAKLTMYPGAIERFDRAIAADPSFALAHAARAHLLLERGDAAAARASMAAAKSLAAGLSAREASHIAYFALLVAGDAEAALAALPRISTPGRATSWCSPPPRSPTA